MAAATRVSSGGLAHLRAFALDANGFPLASVAGATPYSGVQVEMARAFTPNIPDATVIEFAGDDRNQGKLVLPAQEGASFEFTTQKNNLTVDALFDGVLAYSKGDQQFMLRETEKRACMDVFCLLAYQQAVDNTPGSTKRGAIQWRSVLIPKARVVSYMGSMENGNPSESRYQSYPSVVSSYPWGVAFAVGTEGATEAAYIETIMNGRPWLDAWLINNTPTLTLTLGATARMLEDGLNYDMHVYRWANATGVVTDITAASTLGASTITVVGPVADDLVFAWYAQADC